MSRSTRGALLAFALLPGPALAAVSASERGALVALYDSTNGAGWTNRTNWKGSAGTECTWFGVTCNGTGSAILKLELPGNALAGPLPTELGSLPSLVSLVLDHNQLTGPIPSSFGNLTNLTGLSLWANQLTGTIPPSLTNLKKLTYIFLSYNKLTGSIPTGFGAFPELLSFNLDNNPLTGGIPADIVNAKKLLSIQLYNTSLGGPIPAGIGSLTNLTILWLANGGYTGTIPPEIGNLSNLDSLELNGNLLTGPLPASFGNLGKLRILYAYGNKLSGTIPPALANILPLEMLSLRDNDFSGEIPPQLGNLPNLTQLRLSNNRLTGSIPSSIGTRTALTNLWLQGNQLVGAVPASFTNLTKLDAAAGGLDLRYNALSVASPSLLSFLNGRQTGGDVLATQTVPPVNVAVQGVTSTSVALGWQAVAYQSDPGGYEVLTAPPGTGQTFTSAASTISKADTSVTLTGLAPGTSFVAVVRTRTAPGSNNKNLVTSSSGAPVSGATIGTGGPSLAIAPASLVVLKGANGTLTVGRPGDPAVLPAVVTLTSNAAIATVPSTVTIPAGAFVASVPVHGVGAGTSVVTASRGAGGVSASVTATVTVLAACPVPAAPAFDPLPASALAGRSLLVSWSAPASALAAGLSYSLDASVDPAFPAAGTKRTNTRQNDALVPIGAGLAGKTLSLRVRAVQACGTTVLPSPFSSVQQTSVVAPPADYRLLRSGASIVAVAGSVPATAAVVCRNVGGTAGRLSVSASGGFFDASPAQLDLDPNETATVTLTVRPSAVAGPGAFRGSVTLTDGVKTLTSPVALTVAPAGTNVTPGANAAYSVRAGAPAVVFAAPAGQNPASKTLTVTLLGPPGGAALPIVASVGPGGPWLLLPTELGLPVEPGRSVTLTLGVDRSRRTREERVGPVRALLRLAPVGGAPGEAAIVEVVDVEPPALRTGTGRTAAPPPGGSSFVLPTTVHGTSITGATLKSDGWLRNEGLSDASVDVTFTPDGRDGISDASTRALTLAIPAGATYRLTDFLSNLFQISGSGQVELRTLSPRALSGRSSVESLSGNDPNSRFGTEIPVAAWGSGIGFGHGALVVPNVSEDAATRTNLILAETSGAPATARVTVYDAAGRPVGVPVTRAVLAFGKEQINGLVAAASGSGITGGAAVVTVTAGSGRLVALSTVIDNRSGSFSALKGRLVAEEPSAALAAPVPPSRAPRPDEPLADPPPVLIVPSVARLTGANNTQFTTSLALANVTGTAANLALTYHYVDVAAGNAAKSKSANATVPARGSLSAGLGNDVVAGLFGLTTPTYGWIEIGGDAAKVVGTASVSALVDPTDPSKGLKTSQVDALFSTSPELILVDGEDHRFAGVEKSEQRRTNLILVETSGQPCRATVDVADETGAPLGSRTYDLAARQYLQINDVLGDAGVALGEGPFQNLSVRADVASGACQLVGLATVIDNQSKSPQIYLLKSAGPEGSTIGF